MGLSGCGTPPDASEETSEETMTTDYTVEQARQDPIDLVTSTTELRLRQLGVDLRDPWPGFCKTSENEEGASYTYNLRTAQPLMTYTPMPKRWLITGTVWG